MHRPVSNLLSRVDASRMAQFSMELRELEAVGALGTPSQVAETQLDTQAIMHELSVDSEVTFRKVLGSAEILPTRSGIDPFEDTRLDLRVTSFWNYDLTQELYDLKVT